MSSTTTAIIRGFALLEHNPKVREYFRDISNDEGQQLLTGRALGRQACLVSNNDTINIIQFKLWLFNDYILKDESNFYGIPIARFHSESNEFKPQCMLYFQGSKEDEDGQSGVLTAEISFRLFWEEFQVTQSRLQAFV